MSDLIKRSDALTAIRNTPYIKEHPNLGLLLEEWIKSLPDAEPEFVENERRFYGEAD